MEVVGPVASVIAVVELAAKVASTCHEYFRAVKNAEKDIVRLRNVAESVKEVLEKVRERSRKNGSTLLSSPGMLGYLDDCVLQLSRVDEKLQPAKGTKWMKKIKLRDWKWPFETREVDKIIEYIERCMQNISHALQLDQVAAVEHLNANFDLAKLPLADGAKFDSFSDQLDARCHGETRIELRKTIRDWAHDPNGKGIFWLKGMAGTGKSTISRTLAQEFKDQDKLGATFFFKRGEGDRGNASGFFPTIVAQLMRYLPSMEPHARRALDEDDTIAGKGLKEQFDKLLLQPLIDIDLRGADAALIIIDALDECENDSHIKLILQLFERLCTQTKVPVKVFIASRPELPIRLGFSEMSEDAHTNLVLHDIPTSIVEHDLIIYLTTELEQIRKQSQTKLPQDWPGKDKIRVLAAMAVPLFIFAATICRFIGDHRWDPETQLESILEYKDRTHGDQLDRTYRPILDRCLDGLIANQRPVFAKDFQLVVGSIVLLESPLSSRSLAKLINISEKRVDRILSLLQSVLTVPSKPELPVRLLHLSFRDFLVDTSRHRPAELFVNEEQAHQTLAIHCLQLLLRTDSLKQDICNLNHPGILRQDIDSSVIASHLPPEVQYACRYWAYHLKQGQRDAPAWGMVQKFLETRLLYWLEALGLLGRASESIDMIALVKSLTIIDSDSTLNNILYDAQRFILMYSAMVDMAPLQVYSSALIFAPESSIIRKKFQNCIPKWVGRLPQRQNTWTAAHSVFDGHIQAVNCVCFTPDGKMIVSASNDKTIRIWNVNTRTLDQTLQGHEGAVDLVAVSSDGKHLISNSWDKSIRIWDVETGQQVETFKSQGIGVAAFSADNRLAAWWLGGDGRISSRIQVWNLSEKSAGPVLVNRNGLVRSLAFSPQQQHLASTDRNGVVRIWDPVKGVCLKTLETSVDGMCSCSLAYSPDGNRLAIGNADGTISLCDANAGVLLQTLEGHSARVFAVAFSPNGENLASGANIILLWDIRTGILLRTIGGHTNSIFSLCFSPDNTQLVSASYDRTIRMWDLPSLTETKDTQAQYKVETVRFSPDGTTLASGLASETTIRLWTTITGVLNATVTDVLCDQPDSFVFSSDSKLLASISTDSDSDNNYVQLLDPKSGLQTLALEGRLKDVCTMAYSSDCQQLAVFIYPGQECWVWKTDSKVKQRTFKYLSSYSYASAMAFSPDDRKIAVSFVSGQIDVRDIASSSILYTLKATAEPVYCSAIITFSTDGLQLLSGGSMHGSHEIRLWDVMTGALLKSFESEESEEYGDSLSSFAFSPSGDQFAASSYDGSIYICNLASDSISVEETLNTSSTTRKLSFCTSEPYLETERGLIKIKGGMASNSASSRTTRRNAIFLKANHWITRDGENLLWLPPEYRDTCTSYRNNVLAVGHVSGLVSFFEFQFDD
ncbi:hypothetical protein MMC13_000180 [Lambiella insularis]|nr:hypothetical protein [Lambiella insularis]